jgi:O-antigen/teichoic acid export membrane protein
MTGRRAVLTTAVASYVQMATGVLVGLISFPIALHYLDTDRMGLWALTTNSLGFLLLLDFGVVSSVGRLMGDPIHANDAAAYNRCLGLFTLVLALEGLLVLAAGYLSVDWLLDWFSVPGPLKPEGRSLWLWMVAANALTLPWKVYGGVLYAQNRSYWAAFSSALGTWASLISFFLFLQGGSGTMAYAYSTVLSMPFSYLLPWLAVKAGPQRFRISFRGLRWGELASLFNFSSGFFVIGVAVQVIFFSQTLVITKLLGLRSVTLFQASTKAGTLGLKFLWQSFDAFNPRWQQLYVAGDRAHLAASFTRYTGLTMSVAFLGASWLVVLNHPFVIYWTKPELHLGAAFDVLVAIYLVQHAWNHCLSFCPPLAKRIRPMAAVAVLDMVLNVLVSVLFVKLVPAWGVKGVLLGGILGSVTSTLYLTWCAPGYVFLTAGRIVRPFLGAWLVLGGNAALAFACCEAADPAGRNLWLRGAFGLLAAALFSFLHRADLAEFLARGRGALARAGLAAS